MDLLFVEISVIRGKKYSHDEVKNYFWTGY